MGGPAMDFDLVILGSGSTAFAAAIRAANLGKTAAMIESRTLGGTCVNRGCLPSKNLIEAARIVWESRNPRYPGLRPAALGLDFAELVRQKDALVADYRGKKYEAVLGGRITVFDGHARFVSEHAVSVDGRLLQAPRFLVATGTRPAVPPVAGLDDVPFLTSDLLTRGEDHELTALPRSLLVLGGGYIALELGQMFHRFGVEVTLLERSAHLLPREEPEVGPSIAALLREEGVEIVTGATVQRIAPDSGGVCVHAEVAGEHRALCAERLLVATGRRPNTDGIGLEEAGVRTDEAGWIVVDETLRTSAAHVYAAGDVIGAHTGSQLATPVGARDGALAAENALTGSGHRVAHDVIPRTVFTDPQIATVGLTDAQATARGHRCRCRTVAMTHVPRAGAVRDPRGFVKMVADVDSQQVLGVTMVGHDAGEVIHEAAMGLRLGATVRDFAELIHVYPTMAEALKIVALAFTTDVTRLSCCAEG
ncbi:MAG TPA: mercury(II) reductase [Candidatus Limnocylindria bacterium]|nr:mercury(II) reductase [Candidatus Limnocylindria bacterium]